MTEHEAVTKEDEKAAEKDYRKDVQLPSKFDEHRSAFLKMLTELDGI